MKLHKVFLLFTLCISLAFCASTQEKSTQQNESDPEYQYQKASVSMQYNLVDEAIKYLNNALSLDPNHYKSLKLLGHIHFERKNFPEAAAAYEKCLEFQPEDSQVQNNLGHVYHKMGSPEKAEEWYKKALSIDNNFNASFGLSQLYFEQNKLESALGFIRKSIQTNNKNFASFNLQGVILNKMKRIPEAIQSFQAALRLAPNEVITSVNLGIAYINHKDFDSARKLFVKILPRINDPALKKQVDEYLKLIKDR
jgi:tetratricopeptide (TPR) repeat protein